MSEASKTKVAITGNTYPVKDALRALGGTWNPDAKAWMVPQEKEAEAKALVASAPKAAQSSSGYRAPAQEKTCWECGGRFTYGDARRNGGDWKDGYCGC